MKSEMYHAPTLGGALDGRSVMLQRAFAVCVQKSHRNIKDLADEPKTWSWAVDGDYSKFKEGFFEIGN